MKIKILGTRGKIEAKAKDHSRHTGFLIDNRLLIDVGEAEYMDYKPVAVIFTHFHPDHAYFVFDQSKFSPGIPLFGPEEHDLIPNLQAISGKFEIEGYTFTPVPVIHALSLKSLGYIIEKDKKRVFITGDVAWIEKAHLQDIPPLDLVITEASFIKKGGRINRKKDQIFGHTGVPNLIKLLGPYTKRVAFCHYGEWFFETSSSKSRKQIKDLEEDVELIPTHDGMELEI